MPGQCSLHSGDMFGMGMCGSRTCWTAAIDMRVLDALGFVW